MLVKILSDSWLSLYPVTSGNNKSFGPVDICALHEALSNVKNGRAKSEMEKWIEASGFLKYYPIEFVLIHSTEVFVRIMNEYNPRAKDFLDKNTNFYLWFHPQ